MVEGNAENILIPVIADVLGYPLEKNGISIVNVGSTAFLRYSRIMVRSDESPIGIPVSIIRKKYGKTVQPVSDQVFAEHLLRTIILGSILNCSIP